MDMNALRILVFDDNPSSELKNELLHIIKRDLPNLIDDVFEYDRHKSIGNFIVNDQVNTVIIDPLTKDKHINQDAINFINTVRNVFKNNRRVVFVLYTDLAIADSLLKAEYPGQFDNFYRVDRTLRGSSYFDELKTQLERCKAYVFGGNSASNNLLSKVKGKMGEHSTRNALIGAAAVIIAAIIGYLAVRSPPPQQDIQYTGRVIDKRTQQVIKGAEVSVDTQGPPQVYYTDSNGVFTLKLKPNVQVVRLRVVAQSYPVFDGNVSATRSELEDIRLERPEESASVTLPDGLALKDAINFLAGQDNYGVQFTGNCNPKLLSSKVNGGSFAVKTPGEAIDQLKYRLINPPTRSGYNTTRIEERKVYQIECTN
jgi:hypothetical protein